MGDNRCSPGSLDDLLPCPFCGEAPVWERTGFSGRAMHVYCVNDNGCPRPKATGETEEKAIENWNARSPDVAATPIHTEKDPQTAFNLGFRAAGGGCPLPPSAEALFQSWLRGGASHAVREREEGIPDTFNAAQASVVQSALEPFAKIAPSVEYTDKRDGETVHRQWDRDLKQYVTLTKDDFRRAAKAYAALASSFPSTDGGTP